MTNVLQRGERRTYNSGDYIPIDTQPDTRTMLYEAQEAGRGAGALQVLALVLKLNILPMRPETAESHALRQQGIALLRQAHDMELEAYRETELLQRRDALAAELEEVSRTFTALTDVWNEREALRAQVRELDARYASLNETVQVARAAADAAVLLPQSEYLAKSNEYTTAVLALEGVAAKRAQLLSTIALDTDALDTVQPINKTLIGSPTRRIPDGELNRAKNRKAEIEQELSSITEELNELGEDEE